MSPTSEAAPTRPAEPTPAGKGGSFAEETTFDPRNFWAWVAYQFLYRIGWQFKMESTLMAGLVSYLAPSPAVMGLFTTLNTVGKNLSPLLGAPLVDRFRHKRAALLLFWCCTVAVWAALTLFLWTPAAGDKTVALWVFGVCYTLFFAFLGVVGVAQGALLGKIIPAGMRGRAMAVGMTISGGINVAAIYWIYNVVRGGSYPEPRNYALSFTFTVTFFAVGALALLLVREAPSQTPIRPPGLLNNLRYSAILARENRNLSRLMVVNVCVGTLANMLQFYTGFWRTSGSVSDVALPAALVLATVFQVFWQSLSSSILGRVADRRGNRGVIHVLVWVEALIPLSAILFGMAEPFRGHWGWYVGVYTLVGLRFPVYQLLVNYLLEIVPQRDHALALGAVNTVQLLTAPVPLLFGAIASRWGYPAAFVLGSLIGVYGAITAGTLEEVRVGRT